MPEDRDARTEAPTPRRRREARESGNVPRSQDLPAAVVLLVALVSLDLLGPWIMGKLLGVMELALNLGLPAHSDQLVPLATMQLFEGVKTAAPFVGLVALAILVTVLAQVGWLVTFKPLTPDLNRLNPIAGAKRLFSGRMIAMAGVNLGKLLLVGAVAYFTLQESAAEVLFAFTFDFREAFALGGVLAMRLGLRLAAVLIILALIDYAYQRYRHERDLKMTKEEVKDEFRSMEGDPKVKQRRRQLQWQLSHQRLKQDVQSADVVVTNPTHLALALKYDPDTMPAPRLVAKGADYLAERIRRLAMEFGVPIVQRRALARAMYEAVEVGDYIPERFYQAIAEILAYVYELTGSRPHLARPAAS